MPLIDKMIETIRRSIVSHALLSSGDSILVALSGGPDSVALLHVLSRLRRSMKLSLAAVYVNHQIRPRAARREEQFCQRLCEKLSVELFIVSENIPSLAKREKHGLEETGRNFRYRTFEMLADEHGFDRIALGHHQDDQVETVLFRVLRGTGIAGLGSIPIIRGRIIRPLLEIDRSQIETYLKRHRLACCRDRSNNDSRFTRNRIRKKLLPLIRRQINPAVDKALLNLAETASAENRFLADVTARALKQSVSLSLGGKIELDLIRFSVYDIWLRRRVLRHCVTRCSGGMSPPDKVVVDRLEKLALGRSTALSLPGGMSARVLGDHMVVHQTTRISYFEKLGFGDTCCVEPLGLSIRCRRGVPYGGGSVEKERRSMAVMLDASAIDGALVVRNVRRGDRFRPLGLDGEKKIGEYLSDRKVPIVYRDEIPVACDHSGPVWLVGYEIADRVKIVNSTREVVRLECRKIRRRKA
ncbi:MAG: tRNA lysidine(34) synthetase TilS [Candidatus Zixiibacteriota bacterium]